MPDYQPIDYRLRCHTKRTDLPVDVLRDIGEAYAEIERLRKERDEASQRVCSIAYPEQHIQELVKTINTLRVERDEARREICERVSTTRWQPQFPLMPKGQYAEERGWDCFKENTNG
jgi:hypothetical protein